MFILLIAALAADLICIQRAHPAYSLWDGYRLNGEMDINDLYNIDRALNKNIYSGERKFYKP